MRLRSGVAGVLLLALALAAVPRLSLADVLLPLPQARQDLAATARQVVATHPAFNGTSPASRTAASYLDYMRSVVAQTRSPLPLWRFLEAEDLVLNGMRDPHTTLWALYTPLYSSDLLPVGFYWVTDGLVVYRIRGTPAGIATGDRVLSIGNVPASRLAQRLRRFYSGNAQWLHALAGSTLPFGNMLRWLGLVRDGKVALELAGPSGSRYKVSVALAPLDQVTYEAYEQGVASFVDRFVAPPGLREPVGRQFYTWRVTPDYAIFWLSACKISPAYSAAVDAFFRAVQASGVHYVVIDLQQNSGGNSLAGNPLVQHLEIKPAYASFVEGLGIHQNPREVFRGQVYVLIDGGTFSSGVNVAEELSEAAPGVLAGSLSGWASGGPGNVQGFATPNFGIGYQVSAHFMQPLNGRMVPALVPSLKLPVSAADIQKGINPVARWLSHLATPRVKT